MRFCVSLPRKSCLSSDVNRKIICAILPLARRGASVRGKGRSPPGKFNQFREPSFSPMCGQRAIQRKEVAMSTEPLQEPIPLPDNPNLRHLKDQARDLVRDGTAASTSAALFMEARRYGFASWPKLKAHVDSLTEVGEVKLEIDANDLERVKAMMARNPALHAAPLGYGKNGPLTWVAECRVPWEAPKPVRLEMARWMLENGSDVHQGGDGPLMRAALRGDRVPMMELLVEHGADVNAEWSGYFPIIFAPCETVDPVALRWLLEHGANPNCDRAKRKYPGTALDYVIGTYSRSEELRECIDILMEHG